MARPSTFGESPPMTGRNVAGRPACAARRRVARRSVSWCLNSVSSAALPSSASAALSSNRAVTVGMRSALHKVTRTGCAGLAGYALKCCLRKVELKHTQRLIDVPS
jgi:hypothetical protein